MRWIWKGLKILLIVAVAATVLGFITMQLWNWLMPAVFGLRVITFWQAIGLLLLGKLLFGGFHKHGGGGKHGWKRHMEERWSHMSPEERARFKAGMRGGWPCGPRGWRREEFGERETVDARVKATESVKATER